MQQQSSNPVSNKTGGNKQGLGRKGKGIKGSYTRRQRDSLDSEDGEDDHHPGNYSPTSAMRWGGDQDDDDEPDGAQYDHSRRSSLKSSSIIGIEGEEAPGPTHTLNPLDGVAGTDRNTEGTTLLCL